MTAVCSALHPLRVTRLFFCIIAEMPSDEIVRCKAETVVSVVD